MMRPDARPLPAARIERERIAVARIVGVVGTVGHLIPGRSEHRQTTEGRESRAVRPGQNDAGRRARFRELFAFVFASADSSPTSPTFASRPRWPGSGR